MLVTFTLCAPGMAVLSAVTPKAAVLLLLALKTLKLLLSFKAVKLSEKACMMYITPDKPETLESFLVILELISFCFGAISAFTKFWASAAVSTPEPALKELMIFCADA